MRAILKPVSVLLMARELGPGGTERQLTEIAKRLDRAHFSPQAAFFRPGIRSEELEEAGIPCHQIAIRSFAEPEAARQVLEFKRFLEHNEIDIVHTFDYPLTCFAVPIARAAGVPVILSSQRGHRSLIPPHYRTLVRITDLLVDGIVVNCHAMQEHLVRDEEIPRRRTHLCYNGLDVTRMNQERADLRCFETDPSNPGSSCSRPRITIGCLSVLRREKNLHLLLLAAARLLPAVPSLHVLLVGSGPEDSNLKQIAAQLGILSHCDFQPATKNVAYWLSQIDIFVLPSSTEALSNSLMEAMASKCAVVASNVGGTPELIRDGETGLLFASGNISELASRIFYLIRDPALRTLLARNASDLIHSGFTIQQSAQHMSEIYRHFIDAGPTRQ